MLGFCGFTFFASAVLSMPFWLWAGRLLGKRWSWLAYNVWELGDEPLVFRDWAEHGRGCGERFAMITPRKNGIDSKKEDKLKLGKNA